MFAYIVRRVLSTIPTLFGVAIVLFVLLFVAGGDPTYQMVGRHASAVQLAEVRHQYHFDEPALVQFGYYLKEIVTFDYGISFATKQPISEILSSGVGPSLSIALPAFFLTTVLSILIGLLVAYFRGTWIDKTVVVLCVVGMSISILAYILFGQFVLAYQLKLFPISGYEAAWPDRISYVCLPIIIWVTVSLGYDVRFYRTAILEEVNQDYVRTARAKGLTDFVVFLKHVLKNSMIPIMSYVITEIPLLILGSVLLESFFSIPGLGNVVIDAVHNSDFPVLKAITTLGSILYIAGTLVRDILYTLMDPRVSFG